MDYFAEFRRGITVDIRNPEYQAQVHPEIERCRHLCFLINGTDPSDPGRIVALERELFCNGLPETTYLKPPFQVDCGNCVTIGEGCFFNEGVKMMTLGSITIGDGCMIGPDVGLFTVNHLPLDLMRITFAPLTLGNRVWVGARANLLPGVTVGDDAIIGAGAVVTHDVPPCCVVAGNPARVVKRLSPSERAEAGRIDMGSVMFDYKGEGK
ncbi:MAG: maltose O-acetyltransferase [Succinivibrionaceae bacterium]|nr:maltose O-acetyltransferase [Succinivibrionaceae bacterium]